MTSLAVKGIGRLRLKRRYSIGSKTLVQILEKSCFMESDLVGPNFRLDVVAFSFASNAVNYMVVMVIWRFVSATVSAL
jgi:hypothetical protein